MHLSGRFLNCMLNHKDQHIYKYARDVKFMVLQAMFDAYTFVGDSLFYDYLKTCVALWSKDTDSLDKYLFRKAFVSVSDEQQDQKHMLQIIDECWTGHQTGNVHSAA